MDNKMYIQAQDSFKQAQDSSLVPNKLKTPSSPLNKIFCKFYNSANPDSENVRKIILLLFLLLSVPSFSQKPPQEVFKQANELYQKGDYQSAQKYYESIQKKGFNNFETEFNVGNCFYKQKDYASAILHYERAKKWNSEDDDLLFNLQLANLNIIDKIENDLTSPVSDYINNTLLSLSLTTYAWIIIILIFISVGGGFIFILSHNIGLRRLGFFIGIIFLLFSGITFGISKGAENLSKMKYGIVMSSISYIKNAPQESTTDAFYLHAGTKIKLLDKQGQWINIQLLDGKKGWIKSEELVEI